MLLRSLSWTKTLAALLIAAPLSISQASAQSDSGEQPQRSQQERSEAEDSRQQGERQNRSEQRNESSQQNKKQQKQQNDEKQQKQQQQAEQQQRASQQRQQERAERQREGSRSVLLERMRSRRESRRGEDGENRAERSRAEAGEEQDESRREDRSRGEDRSEARERNQRWRDSDERAGDRRRSLGEDQSQRWDRSRGEDRNEAREQRQSWRDSDERAGDRRRRGQDTAQRYRVTPEGWVRIGADYDDDGIYESVQTVYIMDLDRATRRSRERRQQMRGQQRGEMRDSRAESRRRSSPYEARRDGRAEQRRSRSAQSANRLRPRTIEGTIENLQPMQLAGMRNPHLLAKVRTDRYGELPVCLGPRQELSKLNLKSGDQVRIEGIKAQINDRAIVLASKVSTDGDSVSVDFPQRQNRKRVRATIRSTRTANFKRFDEPFLIGEVETRGGRTAMVNFGPKSELGNLNLEQGDQLRLLVRPGRINGERAMIAEEIHAEGQHVKLPRPEDRERFRGGNSSRRNI